jgi:hypothetical protein
LARRSPGMPMRNRRQARPSYAITILLVPSTSTAPMERMAVSPILPARRGWCEGLSGKSGSVPRTRHIFEKVVLLLVQRFGHYPKE